MLQDIRNNYKQGELIENALKTDPVEQFRLWLDEAIEKNVHEPTAMILSSIGSQNRPHSRVVLLKELTGQGFVFFTNYGSAKAGQISDNKFVALTFFWPEIERQVRIDGQAERISHKLSDEYFASRPVDSQLGAWASPQSQVISSRKVLEDNFIKFSEKYGENIPRPKHWGGYLVIPYQIEFWQGRPNRLHDRILYHLDGNKWRIVRLAP